MSWRMRGAALALLASASGACSSDENTGSGATGGAAGATGGAGGTAGSSSSGGTAGSTGGTAVDAGGAPSDGGTCTTSLAASCLGQFFVQANQCFHPAGACVVQAASNGNHICWANGAKLVRNDGPNGGGFTYLQDGTTCFYGSWSAQAGVATSYTFTIDGGDLLVYEPQNGKTTCLDQSQTTVAPDFGRCTSITSLLALDETGCTQGTCN